MWLGGERKEFKPVPLLAHTLVRILQVKVKPGARASRLEVPDAGDVWSAHLKSPPIDGQANRELVALVAKHFACPRSRVSIKSGVSGRMKLVRIEDL